MATTTTLTTDQFETQYRRSDQAFEFWYGEAIPKGLPTLSHGRFQTFLATTLAKAGWQTAGDVELRIDPNARPRPDLIAYRTFPSGSYPTQGPDLVIEILSPDDTLVHLKEQCRKYEEWACGAIYVVDPLDCYVLQWHGGAFRVPLDLGGIPLSNISEAWHHFVS